MTATVRLTLGTRGSPLALAQANEARRRLSEAHGWDMDAIALRIIRTTGDRIQDRPLAEAGGKGLFTKEIDTALLAGEVDAAIHSAKDLPALLPEEIALAGFLPREDPRDAFVSRLADRFDGLPRGASFGAASLRRQAQALRLRPDLVPVLLRGNVETRLRKAEAGEIGATLLAMAGLKRLGLVHHARSALDIDAFLPAPAQGAIAMTARAADFPTLGLLAAIADPATVSEVTAERAYLATLEGSCRTPIAGLARFAAGRLAFRGEVLRIDGSESFAVAAEGSGADAASLGSEAGRELLARLPAGIISGRG